MPGTNAFEAEFLIGILKAKLELHKDEQWLLNEGGLDELNSDFRMLYDFFYGSQNAENLRLAEIYGQHFLSEIEREEFASLKNNLTEQNSWLVQRCGDKISRLWYFSVSLARFLQNRDYLLSPTDCYWLGLIDEVLGYGFPSLRVLLSSLPSEPDKQPVDNIAKNDDPPNANLSLIHGKKRRKKSSRRSS